MKKTLDHEAAGAKAPACFAGRLALTRSETAIAIGCDTKSLRRLELKGLIRSSKALRKKMFPVSEIKRFLEETL